VIIALAVTWQLMRSPWGRVLRAIREDEDAARALGKSAYSYKLQSLVLGGVFAAIAGMLQVTASGSVQPDTFGTPRTFILWTIMIIGGIGRVWGPVAGSIMFWGGIIFIDNLLGEMLETSLADELERWLELSDFNVQQVRFIVMGLALILFMRFRPQGLFGDRQEAALDDR
jgi:branched-chain amino acid transport system permease protein